MKRMKKANYHGIRDIRVEDVANPDPGPGEVRVRIEYCGICGSDVHEYLHGPFPRSPFDHEACGEIVDKAADVTSVDVGDHVLAFGPGAYAEYLKAPALAVRKLDRSIPWERAAVIEPLAGAEVSLIPEECFAGALQPASGTTDESGIAVLSIDAAFLPADAKSVQGVQQGLFRIEIDHPEVEIPAKYNTNTRLGKEVSFETGENIITFTLS